MKPILCNYYITHRCNARCIFCDIWQNRKYHKHRDADLEDVIKNLHHLRKIGVKFIDFTGGEPLLHQNLPKMLETAKQLGFYTSVTTNCILYPKLAEKIKGKVDLLHFSIDSFDEDQHNALRGSNCHQYVMDSIFLASQLQEKPDLLFTVTNSNYKSIKRLSEFAASHQLMLIVNPVFNYANQQSLNKTAVKYISRFQFKPYVYINRAIFELIKNGGNNRNQPRCRAVTSTIVKSPGNELLLPCFHFARFKIPIQANLTEIITSPIYQQLKLKQGRYKFCQGCTINCYFDPSFLYKFDRYFWLSLLSKAKYGFDKYVRGYFDR